MAESTEQTVPIPPYRAAIAAGLAAFALYVFTLAPTTAFWDTSEYIATAHIVGIPHPPGNPLFVVLAKAWSLLLAPTGLPVAIRVNLLAATTSAAAAGFFYLVAHRVISVVMEDGRTALVGAAASTVIASTAFTVWNQSNVNEKVYTVSVLVIAAASWLGIRWRDRCDERGSERLLLWAGFLLMLGWANHQMSLLPGPALLLLVLLTKPSVLIRPAFVWRAVTLAVVGLSFNYVLPIRSGLDPMINEGQPTCESVVDATEAIYSLGRSGCRPLAANLTREQYQTPPVTARKAPFSAQMQMFLQYFEWQWARGIDAAPTPSPRRLPFSLLFFLLGSFGLWVTFRADRVLFAYLFTLGATVTVGLVVYLNFKYGYSLSPHITNLDMHEVRERDYFFISSFMYWGVMAGLGLAAFWHLLANGIQGEAGDRARAYRMASPVLLIALIPLAFNWSWASRAGDYAARDWAYNLLMSVEPYGVLFTNGDNDTFPLWYMQEVEGIRQDVTVIVGQYLYTTWYIEQLQRHTTPGAQRAFNPEIVPGLYDHGELPTGSIVQLTPDQMRTVAAVRLDQDLTLGFPNLAVMYPAGMVLDRSHQLALRIIQDSIGERPIYFSASGGMINDLGLRRWGVRHGLATKLDLRSLEDDERPDLVQGSEPFGGEWFDLDHSLELYQNVYQYRGMRGREIWQDNATFNIPMQYYAMVALIADAARNNGVSNDLLLQLNQDALDFQIVSQGGHRVTPALVP